MAATRPHMENVKNRTGDYIQRKRKENSYQRQYEKIVKFWDPSFVGLQHLMYIYKNKTEESMNNNAVRRGNNDGNSPRKGWRTQ